MVYRFKIHLGYLNKSIDVKFFVMNSLVIDMEISNDEYLSTDTGIIVFTLTSLIYLVSQQYILSYSQQKPGKFKEQ
jgi:hypothetical protein